MSLESVRRIEGAIALAAFIGSIWLANWLVLNWGAVRFPGGRG
jgi:hypothetical protein